MADPPNPAAGNALRVPARNPPGRRPREALICRCVRSSMRKVRLGAFYNYLWGVRKTTPQRITRQNNPPRRRELAPFTFLSPLHGHDSHSQCFETHLTDAVRLNTFLRQLEAEQKASEEAFDKFHSDLAMSEIIIDGHERSKLPYAELLQKIEDSSIGKFQCIAADNERSRVIRSTQGKLRKAMDGIFESFAEGISQRPPTDRVSELDVALAKCKACYQQLKADESTYLDMLKNTADQPGSAEYTETLEGLHWERRSNQAMIKTYRALELDLLENHATLLLGPRAHLIHPLSLENLEKLTQSQLPVQAELLSPTISSLTRRSARDPEGRPLGPDGQIPTEELPPVDARGRAFAGTNRRVFGRNRGVLKVLMDLRTRWCHAVAEHRLLFADITLLEFSKIYKTPDGELYPDAERAIIGPHKAYLAEESRAWRELVAQHPCPAPASSTTLRSVASDYNAGSETFEARVGRLDSAKPNLMRKWNATAVRNHGSDVDLNDLDGSMPSSDQAMGTPSDLGNWFGNHRPETERIVKRLRRHKTMMKNLRKRCRVERTIRSWVIERRSYSAQKRAWVST